MMNISYHYNQRVAGGWGDAKNRVSTAGDGSG